MSGIVSKRRNIFTSASQGSGGGVSSLTDASISGVSLIENSTGVLRTLLQGTNISIVNNGNGTISISSNADDITVVANYSALPAANTVSGQFYWCSASQGTAWLPGSLGGTYYSAGLYYSNGTIWEFMAVPYQATQAEVDAGTVTDKFVTPKTFNDSAQLAGKFPNPTGLVTQYIRGDGTLANFPNSTGGGASVSYYLNGSVSQGTFGGDTYYQMSKTPILGAGTNFVRTNGAGDGYIASFITDANDPSFLNIPGGNWNLEFYFQSSASGGSPQFYAELYKVSSTNVFTLVASGSTNPEGITNGTIVDQYYTAIPIPQTSLLITDRLAVRIYIITGGRTITLHTENGNLCQIITTFTTGLTALNGLTDQVQNLTVGTGGTDFNISSATSTHTFNLPTASSTNRGALSSTDWITFNGKQAALGYTPVPNTRTLTINGTALDLSADRSWTVSSGITVGTTTITSGTSGRIPFNNGGVYGEDSGITYSSANKRLTLGGTTGVIPLIARNSTWSTNFHVTQNNDRSTGAIGFFNDAGSAAKTMSILYRTEFSIQNENAGNYPVFITTNEIKLNYNAAISTGVASATAKLHIGAQTASANTAPLKLTDSGGVLMTTPENGAFELSNNVLYFTVSGTRKIVTLV
jgi:hypothetical protein